MVLGFFVLFFTVFFNVLFRIVFILRVFREGFSFDICRCRGEGFVLF